MEQDLLPLLAMLDDVATVPLELALLGDGSASTPCLLCIDSLMVGVKFAPTRQKLMDMCVNAKYLVRDSEAARLLPPVCYGVPTIDLLAAVVLYTFDHPYPLHFCITTPLNVSGKRTLQSLQQQLPYLKLFTLGLRCLPPGPTYHFKGALYCGVNMDSSTVL
jgi:hypothetical protein